MILKAFIVLFFNILLVFSQSSCPSGEKGPSVEQTKAFRSIVNNLLTLNKEILELLEKCPQGVFSRVSSVTYGDGTLLLGYNVFSSILSYFEPVFQAESDTCFEIIADNEEWPRQKYQDLNSTITGLKAKNPVVFEKLVKELKKALEAVKKFYTECNSKDPVLEHPFFKSYASGFEIEQVDFIPKNLALTSFSFEHNIYNSGSESSSETGVVLAVKKVDDKLSDLLKFLDSHFLAKVTQKPFGPQHIAETSPILLNNNEDPRGAHGFQFIYKTDSQYKTLDTLKLRLNLNGNLTLYLIDGNRVLREVETVPNIDTKGKWALVSLKELNIRLADKDILLVDYEGFGAFGKREPKKEGEEIIGGSENFLILNKFVLRDQFLRPKVGVPYEIRVCRMPLDAEITLAKSDAKVKRQPAKVEVSLI